MLRVSLAVTVASLCSVGLSAQSGVIHLFDHVPEPYQRVSGAGDTDGDGFADLIVANCGPGGAGHATLYSGRTGGVLRVFRGDDDEPLLAEVVSAAGDVNGDGFDDVLIGIPVDDQARVYCGQSGTLLHSFGGSNLSGDAGYSAAAAGDVDGDGFDDVIVGAPRHAANGVDSGRAAVFSGRTGTMIWFADGAAAGDQFGMSVCGAGDADADGFDDVAVSTTDEDDPVSGGADFGSVRLFSVKKHKLLHLIRGWASGGGFGKKVTSAGDFNRDGFDDLLISSPGYVHTTDTLGAAMVHSGKDGTRIRGFREDTGGNCDYIGQALDIAGLGDVDGDGFDDIAIGGYRFWDAYYAHGVLIPAVSQECVWVYSGRNYAMLAFFGGPSTTEGWFRARPVVGSTGDVDGDGYHDLIVTSPIWPPQAYSVADKIGLNGTPPRMRELGAACPGSNGHLPSIDHRGRLAAGEHVDFTLRGALPNSVCALVMAAPVERDLGLFLGGLAGCRQYAEADFIWSWTTTDGEGMAARGFDIPNWPSLIGLPLSAQWGCFDAAANPFGATTSDSLKMVLGN